MKYITHFSQLEVGREYWLVHKQLPCSLTTKISECKQEGGLFYFENRIWAFHDNNQAMERWHIFGPLPVRHPPDFKALMTEKSLEKPSDDCVDFVKNIEVQDEKHFMGCLSKNTNSVL